MTDAGGRGGAPPKFLLTGTYNSLNRGDAAMERATIEQLCRCWPSAAITVSSPFPELDRPFYAPVPVVASGRRRGGPLLRGLFWAALMILTRRSDRVARSALASAEARATVEADVVIDLSGDMVTEDYGVLVGFSHLFPILLAWAAGTPYVLLAQSIGPLRWLRPLASFLLRRASAITAREDATPRLLAGYDVPVTARTADMAFLLRPEAPPDDLELPSGALLGVAISALMADRYRRLHGGDLVDELAPVIGRVADALDATVVTLAHVTGPGDAKDDRIPARQLASEVAASGQRAVALDGELDPGQLKTVIGRCRLLIGARMHANIAALSQGVPVVALSYSHKTEGIMGLFGQDDAVVPVGRLDAAAVESAIDDVIGTLESRRRTIAARGSEIRRLASGNLDIVAQVLSGEVGGAR